MALGKHTVSGCGPWAVVAVRKAMSELKCAPVVYFERLQRRLECLLIAPHVLQLTFHICLFPLSYCGACREDLVRQSQTLKASVQAI